MREGSLENVNYILCVPSPRGVHGVVERKIPLERRLKLMKFFINGYPAKETDVAALLQRAMRGELSSLSLEKRENRIIIRYSDE